MTHAKIPSIALLTCMWKRPRLADLVFRNYAVIRQRLRGVLDLHLVAVGSEGAASRDLAEQHGFVYLEQANSPLGAKWNRGMEAVRACGADAMVVVGSDDLLNAELFAIYARRLTQGDLFVGLADSYFWDLASRRLALWHGYPPPRRGEPIGLGRLIHRDLLAEMDWQPWEDGLERGLDRSMMFKLAPLLENQAWLDRMTVLSCRQGDIAPVDVKTDENMWGFEEMLMRSMAFDLVDDMAVLGRHYDSEILEGLLNLSGVRRPPLPSRRSFAPAPRITVETPAGGSELLRGVSMLVVSAAAPHELESPSAMRAVGLTALAAGAGANVALVSLFPGVSAESTPPSRVAGTTFYAAPDGRGLAARIEALAPDLVVATGPMTSGQAAALLAAVASARDRGRDVRLVRDTPALTEKGRREAAADPLDGCCEAVLVQDAGEAVALEAAGKGPAVVAPAFFPGPPCDASFEMRRNLCFAGNLLNTSLRSRIRLFIRRGLPLVRQALPGTLFSLFSFLPGPLLQDLAGEGVLHAGDMRDISRVMTFYAAFVSFENSFSGACEGFQGLALACGMPVITGGRINTFQAPGEREHFLQSSPVEMAQTCITLLSDAALWQKTSDQARRLADNAHNRGMVLNALAGLA